ncbi:MAG: ChaN family lipoprotein [Thermotogae bacterium]|nr:ChaN family lipoprotein [Thermotogota bacterium]
MFAFMALTGLYDLQSGQRVPFDTLIERIVKGGHRVVYLGEVHTSPEIHDFQMRVIEALYARDSNITIAYEMFQQPAQPYLDAYVKGEIHEVVMLYKARWHETWKYDIGLYRETWKFAREKGIPLLAINVPDNFRKKARNMSYDRLRKTPFLPRDLQEPDSQYIAQFKSMMGGHSQFDDKTLERFLKAMIVWDEGMAYAIAKYMKRNPNRRIIVLVGSGHVYNRLGIPSRVERMTGERGIVVIPLSDLDEDFKKADFGVCW